MRRETKQRMHVVLHTLLSVYARVCAAANDEFLFRTFCLALTQAVQVKMFRNKIEQRILVRVCDVLAFGLWGAL